MLHILRLVWFVGVLTSLCHSNGFIDFIECFTTTFLRAHSWLNWVVVTVMDISRYTY